MLKIKNLNVSFSGVNAVKDVSFEAKEGEMLCLCGRNGAGKSSILKAIAGMENPDSGEIILDETNITDVPLRERLSHGITFAPEDRKLFEELTVEENIKFALINMEDRNQEDIYQLFPDLEDFPDRQAKSLSGGQQKMVSLARAIMPSPRVLLVDEMLEGLAESLRKKMIKGLRKMVDRGTIIVSAESSIDKAQMFADRVLVIERGEIINEGNPKEMKEFITETIRGD